MRLDSAGLAGTEPWEAAGYRLPSYQRPETVKRTRERPFWIHFGAGNIFRAFQANVVQSLLNDGVLDRGLIVAEGYDYEIIEKINRPHDDYSILATLKSDGSLEKTVVGSVAESLILDPEHIAGFNRLKEIFSMDSLQMATFTITEKGYSLTDGTGSLLPQAARDLEAGPEKPESYMGKVAALLYHRFLSGQKPLAMVSMDNCSHNGAHLQEALTAFASSWAKNGKAEKEFAAYLQNPQKISFPWTMIDKITPRPDSAVEKLLTEDGVEAVKPVITEKNTYAAPFVNAEECEYLVLEDSFPNGRPPLEKGGLIFTDRETVEKAETMKVCTCLNPLHTALAIFGCLLGYDRICKEMQDPALKKLAEGIGYREGLPVAVDPGILNPKEFIDTVLNIRIPNPFMPDTPQRIATDTSQKLGVRFGETVKAYMRTPGLKTADLKLIPLVFAGWLRYLMGVDDTGAPFELSPDPLLDFLRPCLDPIRLEDKPDALKLLNPILTDEKIFGVDLCGIGMASQVCAFFCQMLEGPGAVRRTLEKTVK